MALKRKKFLMHCKTVTFHPHTQSQAADKGESVDTEPIRTLMLTGFKSNTDRSKLTFTSLRRRKSLEVATLLTSRTTMTSNML
jgi:hypothetical protein